MKKVKIAVASGKGGTGKTMVATSLAACLASDHQIQFLDCDVEAPNAHLFLIPQIKDQIPAVIWIPTIDEEICTRCGLCVKGCAFNALAQVKEKVLLFQQLCHGCGNCSLLCPANAISERPRQIGWVKKGEVMNKMAFLMGELTISEPMPTPIIRQLKSQMSKKMDITIMDSPPGASCAVVATVSDADFIILVTEQTPFGLHDIQQMLGIIKHTQTLAGVIINRSGIGDQEVKDFIKGTGYPLLMEIPYHQRIASRLAEGLLFSDIMPAYRTKFTDLYSKIVSLIDAKAV